MRCETLRNMGIMALVGFGILGTGAGQADAQVLGRRRVTVQETVVTPPVVVAPAPVVVTPTRVKVRPNKVVIKEKRGVVADPGGRDLAAGGHGDAHRAARSGRGADRRPAPARRPADGGPAAPGHRGAGRAAAPGHRGAGRPARPGDRDRGSSRCAGSPVDPTGRDPGPSTGVTPSPTHTLPFAFARHIALALLMRAVAPRPSPGSSLASPTGDPTEASCFSPVMSDDCVRVPRHPRAAKPLSTGSRSLARSTRWMPSVPSAAIRTVLGSQYSLARHAFIIGQPISPITTGGTSG